MRSGQGSRGGWTSEWVGVAVRRAEVLLVRLDCVRIAESRHFYFWAQRGDEVVCHHLFSSANLLCVSHESHRISSRTTSTCIHAESFAFKKLKVVGSCQWYAWRVGQAST